MWKTRWFQTPSSPTENRKKKKTRSDGTRIWSQRKWFQLFIYFYFFIFLGGDDDDRDISQLGPSAAFGNDKLQGFSGSDDSRGCKYTAGRLPNKSHGVPPTYRTRSLPKTERKKYRVLIGYKNIFIITTHESAHALTSCTQQSYYYYYWDYDLGTKT